MLIADLIQREKARDLTAGITIITLITITILIFQVDREADVGGRLFNFGKFFEVFAMIGLLSSVIVVVAAWRDLNQEIDLGVFYSLLLLANMGGLLVASSQNFIPLYIGYELISIPTYAMVAFRKRSRNATEAGLKIFLLGALSSAILVYGLSMYYGATGTFDMGAASLDGSEGLQVVAVALIAAGSGFKIGLIPFHFWIPDVYSGASASAVNFLSASSKKMAFAFVFQLFFVGMYAWADMWGIVFAGMAALSIIIGNIAAVVQDKVMRIIAYSTIAQAGYIAIGIAAYAVGLDNADVIVQNSAMKGIIYHIIAHVLMKGAAIAAILLVMESYGNDDIENFRGLFHKDPIVAGSLAIALFSLMGIPPAGGFFGKFFLFLAAIDADLLWLAILGIIGSAISIYYYGRLIRIMVEPAEDETEIVEFTPLKFLLIFLTILTLLLGFFGDIVVSFSESIVEDLQR